MGFVDFLAAAALGTMAAGAALLARAREGLPGADEGYLWYGTLRVRAGEAPLRDFRSYEPGRYLWCALLARRLGEGLVALRISVHAFLAGGLAGGLIALRLDGAGWPAVCAAALVLALWSYPAHKLFEPALLLLAVLAGTEVVASPGLASELILGATVGLTGFFGANLALYTGTGALALTLVASLKAPAGGPAGGLGGLALGVLAGSVPLLAWFALTPGSLATFWERRVRTVVRRGTTNLALPVPWPWRFREQPDPLLTPVGNLFLGLGFTLLPLLGLGVWLWAALTGWSQLHGHPALAAAAAVGLPALHHAFSRADLSHLAPPVAPFVIVLFALFPAWPLVLIPLAVLVPAALSTVIAVHPRRARSLDPRGYERVLVRSSRLWVPSVQARQLEALGGLVDELLQPGEPVAVVPTLPALLPLLDRRSGVYDTFCVYPAGASEQARMLCSIDVEEIRLVVVQDLALDDRDELRFPHTHPRVWRALESEFERLSPAGVAPDLHVFWRPRPLPLRTLAEPDPGGSAQATGVGVSPLA